MAALANQLGARVIADYDAQAKIAANIRAEAHGQANSSATVGGTIKAVDVLAGTMTIAIDSGADLALKVTASSQVTVNNTALTLADLVGKLGSRVVVNYNTQTKTVTSIRVEARGQVTGADTTFGAARAVTASDPVGVGQ
jgi:hypothetical protein